MGVVATPAPWGLQSQNLAKKFPPAGVLLGHHVSQNCVSKVSDPGPPLKDQISAFKSFKSTCSRNCPVLFKTSRLIKYGAWKFSEVKEIEKNAEGKFMVLSHL